MVEIRWLRAGMLAREPCFGLPAYNLRRPGEDVARIARDPGNIEDIDILLFRTVGIGLEPVRRALRLLARVVSPAQRRELARYGYFTVRVQGHGDYRILPRSVFNVLELDSGAVYCAGPLIPVPIPDLMLMQKLVLETEPWRFFNVANRRQADIRTDLRMDV